ncbi:MAG: UDP-N-acetylglucosamine 4-epimerase [Alphaproteobacteria bacterium MarineAlpha9_Bin1]|nr:MAG: UDP-N-acetylglucosamine 4-epimerase [Alphaproteobacteria bacterium MarineAlpha9_Bin1]
MTIMITGVAGFIGFHLANQLLKRGENILGIDNLSKYYDVNLKRNRLKILDKFENFNFINVDISDHNNLETCFKGNNLTLVCHLAAQAGVRYSLENPREYIKTNLVGHANILESCRKFGVNNLVYASSSSVYGGNMKVPFAENDKVNTPISLYAATKRSDELLSYTYSHLYKINTIGLRFFTVYGPWGRPDMATWIFTKNILSNKPIKVFNHGKMRRDFTYIDDIIAGTTSVLDYLINNKINSVAKIYNIGNNNPVGLIEFINLIEESLGKKAKMSMQPLQLGDVVETYADITSIQAEFDFVPSTPLTKGIPLFIKWYREYHNL